jgi:ABC-type lipoprotein export system ATPase subunit
LASPHPNPDITDPGRPGGRRTAAAAEKAQAREVPLRRIGRLFTPYRWPLAIVTAIIAASSVAGLASPFLLRAVIDDALPDRNIRLLAWLAAGMVAVAAVTSAFGVIQTWISTQAGQQVIARPAHRRLRPPAAAAGRVLHPHPHRGDPVPHPERHRRHGIGRHLGRHLHRRQPHHRGRLRGGHGRPVVAAVPHLAGGHAAGHLPDPQGGRDAPGHHRPAAARTGRPQRHHLAEPAVPARDRPAVHRRVSGSTLALAGQTGSGKTTLAALAARLYDPGSGSIPIDGTDIRDMALADLAAVVGVVSQETYLLHTTIRENLRYARPGATDAETEHAARAAQTHDLIAALPEGYQAIVGSRGHRFSGGEKQRLAIARTLLRDPRVLVLDEATSALDTHTEHAIQQAFDTLAQDRTTITIAHRLTTARNADQIIVLDHGRISETGTHTSLISDHGHYALLAA